MSSLFTAVGCGVLRLLASLLMLVGGTTAKASGLIPPDLPLLYFAAWPVAAVLLGLPDRVACGREEGCGALLRGLGASVAVDTFFFGSCTALAHVLYHGIDWENTWAAGRNAALWSVCVLGVVRLLLGRRSTPSGDIVKDCGEPLRGRTVQALSRLARQFNRRRAPDLVPWGGLLLDRKRGHLAPHSFVLGATGMGKTLTIDMVARAALAPKGQLRSRALVFEAKGNGDAIASLLGSGIPRNRIVHFQPFVRSEFSRSWDLAADIETLVDAEQLAAILISEAQGAYQSNPFFTLAARDLLASIIKTYTVNAPGRWIFNDIIEGTSGLTQMREVLAQTEQGARVAELYLDQRSEETVGCILATIRTELSRFASVGPLWAALGDACMSLTQWIESEEPYVIVLGTDDARSEVLRPLNQALFRRAVELVLSQPENPERETWVFIDELASARELDALPAFLTKARSKRGYAVLGSQSIAGLNSIYEKSGTDAILAETANLAFLGLRDPQSTEWVADGFLGKFEYWETVSNWSQSHFGPMRSSYGGSSSLKERPAALRQDFLSIPPTGPSTGMTGVFYTPALGPWAGNIPWDFIMKHVPRKVTVALEQMPSELQSPRHWTQQDRVRLNLRDVPPQRTHDEPGGEGLVLPIGQ